MKKGYKVGNLTYIGSSKDFPSNKNVIVIPDSTADILEVKDSENIVLKNEEMSLKKVKVGFPKSKK
jgi:hypothetical protein